MEILELIEMINDSHGYYEEFCFLLENHNGERTEHLVNHLGERIGSYTYYGPAYSSHHIQGKEDAIEFLFDCDIHLYQLTSWEVSLEWNWYKKWNITLRRDAI